MLATEMKGTKECQMPVADQKNKGKIRMDPCWGVPVCEHGR